MDEHHKKEENNETEEKDADDFKLRVCCNYKNEPIKYNLKIK